MADYTTINDFFNFASTHHFARDFFLRVKEISFPGLHLGTNDLIFAKTASLPGRTIENKQVNYSGQTFNLNGKASYPNSESYSIEFYHTQDINLRTKLEKASRFAFNNEDTTGQLCMPGNESYMVLSLLGSPCARTTGTGVSPEWEEVETIKFVGVSIRDIGEVAYNIADGTGEILSIPCTFSYHWYENFALTPARELPNII